MKLRHQRLNAGLTQCLGLIGTARLVHAKAEPFQPSDEFALDGHFTLIVYVSQKALLLFEPAKQNAGPPVHKSLCERAMQRV